MKWAYCIAVIVVTYTYIGYPVLLWVRSRWSCRPVLHAPLLPSVSVLIAVRNEEAVLPAKLQNLSALDYPEELLEVIVISDGSTDRTNEILKSSPSDHLRVILHSEHEGKACALNHGLQIARGEIILFTDGRQRLEREALRRMVANFADPSVGCVSGELMLGPSLETGTDKGVGLYWTLEKRIRQWESMTGSVVGATGSIYAVRKNLVVPMPAGTILDDVFIPLHVVRQGRRVIFDPDARAWDSATFDLKHEFRRKVRTLMGNYQLLQLAPWVLTRANPVRFELISHKLLRLLVPFALLTILVGSVILPGAVYGVSLGLQLAFYGLGGLGLGYQRSGLVSRLANVALTFLVLNSAAVVALANFLTGKKEVWVR